MMRPARCDARKPAGGRSSQRLQIGVSVLVTDTPSALHGVAAQPAHAAGRRAKAASEAVAEMAVIGEAQINGDLCHRAIGFEQQCERVLQPNLRLIAMNARTDHLAKDAAHVKHGHMLGVRQLVQRNRLLAIPLETIADRINERRTTPAHHARGAPLGFESIAEGFFELKARGGSSLEETSSEPLEQYVAACRQVDGRGSLLAQRLHQRALDRQTDITAVVSMANLKGVSVVQTQGSTGTGDSPDLPVAKDEAAAQDDDQTILVHSLLMRPRFVNTVTQDALESQILRREQSLLSQPRHGPTVSPALRCEQERVRLVPKRTRSLWTCRT